MLGSGLLESRCSSFGCYGRERVHRYVGCNAIVMRLPGGVCVCMPYDASLDRLSRAYVVQYLVVMEKCFILRHLVNSLHNPINYNFDVAILLTTHHRSPPAAASMSSVPQLQDELYRVIARHVRYPTEQEKAGNPRAELECQADLLNMMKASKVSTVHKRGPQ